MSKVKAQSSNFPLTFILSPRSLCRNRRKRYVCHSERSEESRRISVFQPIDSTRFFTSFRMTDIAFPPITTQSQWGEDKGEGRSFILYFGHLCLFRISPAFAGAASRRQVLRISDFSFLLIRVQTL